MLNGMYICFELIFVQKKTLYLQECFCIPDRSDQVHYFMAPFCSTCSLFTFVCVCFTDCSINYSGRLIVLLTRSPKIIPTQDPHEDLKKERKQKHTIMTIVGQKSRLNIQTSLKCVEARQCYA